MPGRRQFLQQMTGLVLSAIAAPLGAGNGSRTRKAPGNGRDHAGTTLFLAGDVMTGRGIDHVLPYAGNPRLHEPVHWHARAYVNLAEQRNGPISRPVDFDYPWGDALAVLDRYSPAVRIVNLETTITTAEEHRADKPVHFRMHPENLPCLEAAGLDCCALANNHILDWGQAGLDETLNHLHRAGILTAGAGRDLQQATAPAIINLASGRRILVLGYGHPSSGIPAGWGATADRGGIHLLPQLSDAEVETVTKQLADVRRSGDIVIASIHWGGNWSYHISLAQQRFAHALIDQAGVDIIHGHSSHHPKGIEVYKNKLILYGCGDLLNDYEGIAGHEEYRGDLTFMYFPVIDEFTGELVRLELTPMRIKRFRLQHASDEESRWLLDMLNREGEVFGTRAEPLTGDTIGLMWD